MIVCISGSACIEPSLSTEFLALLPSSSSTIIIMTCAAVVLLALTSVVLPTCLFLPPALGDTPSDFSTTLLVTRTVLPSSKELLTNELGFSDAVNACSIVHCGHGRCIEEKANFVISSYSCECSQGWAKPLNWSWVPCLIPNCTIHRSCNNHSSSPAPSPGLPGASPSTNACSLPVCGNGRCIPGVDGSSYTCECDPGYTNLFNSSKGLCLTQCQIGSDCSNLGISIGGNSSNTASPDESAPSSSQGFRYQLWHGNYALPLVESLIWLALLGHYNFVHGYI